MATLVAAGCSRILGSLNDALYKRLVRPEFDAELLHSSLHSDKGLGDEERGVGGDFEMGMLGGNGDTTSLVSSEKSSSQSAYDVSSLTGPGKVIDEKDKPRRSIRRKQSAATLFDFGGKKSMAKK